MAQFLGFEGELKTQCAEQVKRLYEMFLKVDCLQLEVNPLAETPEGIIYTADAKLVSKGYVHILRVNNLAFTAIPLILLGI